MLRSNQPGTAVSRRLKEALEIFPRGVHIRDVVFRSSFVSNQLSPSKVWESRGSLLYRSGQPFGKIPEVTLTWITGRNFFFFPFFHRNGLPSEKKIEPFLIVLFIFNDLFSFNPSGNLRAFCDLVPIGEKD